MVRSVTSSSEEEEPDVQFDVPDLQPPVSQPIQVEEEIVTSRPNKIRNIRGRNNGGDEVVRVGGIN